MKTLNQKLRFPSLWASLLLSWVVFPVVGQAEVRIDSADLVSMVWTGDRIIAVNEEGEVVESGDLGESFTAIGDSDLDQEVWKSVAISGDTVVVVGDSAQIARSTDGGLAWADVSPESSDVGFVDFNAVAPGPGSGSNQTWVAAGGGFDSVSFVYSSDNGETWSVGSVNQGSDEGSVKGVVWELDSGTWFAVGSNGMGAGGSWMSGDGQSWTFEALPAGSGALQAVATDGSGNVLAVGEEGRILSWSGSEWISLGNFSENFYAVVAVGEDEWVIGGEDLQVSWNPGTGFSGESQAGSGTVQAYLLIEDAGETTLYVGGEELQPVDGPTPPNPPDMEVARLLIARDGNDLLLTLDIPGADAGNTFRLESSTNLVQWDEVAGTVSQISSFPYTWDAISINPSEPRRFWRAVWVENP